MSIPATSSNSAEAIKQTPAAMTESVALEQPDKTEESALSNVDQAMVESYEIFIPRASEQISKLLSFSTTTRLNQGDTANIRSALLFL